MFKLAEIKPENSACELVKMTTEMSAVNNQRFGLDFFPSSCIYANM